jgi:hypothetical protein
MARIALLIAATAAILLTDDAPLAAQASPPDSDRIVFPFEHSADLRGVLNVFEAFRFACLRHPLTADLPARLVPAGYQVVTRDAHWWGKDEGQFRDTAILSRTGREDSDIAGGYPIIDLMLPTEKLPNGTCSARWKRAWEPANASQRMSLDLAASLPARVSFHLGSVLISQPDQSFDLADRYASLTTWKTPCLNAKECTFRVNAAFNAEGIDMTIMLDEIKPMPRR